MNPAGYQYPIALRTWTGNDQLTLLLAAPAQAPLNSYGFQNPQAPSFPVALRTFTSDGRLVFTTLPFAAYYFPNPRGAGFPISLRTLADGGWLLVSAKPFAFSEYPNPRNTTLPTSLLTWIADNQLGLLLATQAQAPFANYDFPNPYSPPSHFSALRAGIDQGFSVLLGAPSGSSGDGWLPYFVRRRHRQRSN